MPSTRNLTTAELLLELLELASLGELPADQAVRQMRRSHRFTRVATRVDQALASLEQEGLLTRTGSTGRPAYRVTESGLDALERQGRYPAGAAVIFTDIVGSTGMIAEFGEDGAHQRRQRHFALLHEAVASRGGRVVKNLGDGLMIVFADPTAALDCALAMQRDVAADADRLGLRVGLHAGELLREEGDFFGSTVIVAQRLCERAESGQVIVSEDVQVAAGDRLGAGVGVGFGAGVGTRMFELGQIDLKGLRDPIGAYAFELPTPGPRDPESQPLTAGAS
ncbi:MAG: hypothetical protein HY827_03615 [Actinobacteria bacterium]|nr:hypothetical protein [Actinomycetota bacterium]